MECPDGQNGVLRLCSAQVALNEVKLHKSVQILQICKKWNMVCGYINVRAGLKPALTIFHKHYVYSLMNFCTMPLAEPVEVRGFP